jgi:DNA polymerase III epsilon subunit-like protein
MRWPDTYAVFDFETTGLDIQTLEVIEIGLKLVLEGHEPKEPKTWLIKPRQPISDEITQLTGITQGELDERGIDFRHAFGEFLNLAAGYPLVGHNIVRYDLPILDLYIERDACFRGPFTLNGYPRSRRAECIDTAALFRARLLRESQFWHEGHYEFARRVLGIKAYGKYNLTVACQEMGVDLTGLEVLHRAGSDVEACYRLFKKLTSG